MSMQSMHLSIQEEEERSLSLTQMLTIVATQWVDISRGELNMCMVVIFDTLLLIIQSMCCVSCYVNAEIRYKKALILCPA